MASGFRSTIHSNKWPSSYLHRLVSTIVYRTATSIKDHSVLLD